MSPGKLNGETRAMATTRQLSCEVGSEVVLLQLDDGKYFGLNEVGAEVWRLLSAPRSLKDVVDAVVEAFEVERGECEADVLELIAELHARRLVLLDGEIPGAFGSSGA
jgi:hypothetical protein